MKSTHTKFLLFFALFNYAESRNAYGNDMWNVNFLFLYSFSSHQFFAVTSLWPAAVSHLHIQCPALLSEFNQTSEDFMF